ncbi:hypothetical protein [Sphingobacterium humi]|uniref:FabZ n=1 Tax=Sphingobacterium humi TaxID=1796905 RepID=A0A6N8L324_9SPHI|nr:hypothetical protein [Sphingobacterium humi]MVZ62548.1 hypothetical protein [Sphingobacterium humi]
MKHGIPLPIIDQDIIQQCIPQRPPMLMLDSLLAYASSSITVGLTVTSDNIFTQNSALQEAGVLEHMAQAVALHTGYGYFLRQEEAPIGYIGSISNLGIFDLPQVGQQIISTADIIQEFAGVTLVAIRSEVDGKLIAEGQMKTVIAK